MANHKNNKTTEQTEQRTYWTTDQLIATVMLDLFIPINFQSVNDKVPKTKQTKNQNQCCQFVSAVVIQPGQYHPFFREAIMSRSPYLFPWQWLLDRFQFQALAHSLSIARTHSHKQRYGTYLLAKRFDLTFYLQVGNITLGPGQLVFDDDSLSLSLWPRFMMLVEEIECGLLELVWHIAQNAAPVSA